jgi:hypothetical protein
MPSLQLTAVVQQVELAHAADFEPDFSFHYLQANEGETVEE